jgi:two-component sensor histidine kinase
MESLLRLLPRRLPIAVRYGITALIVSAGCLLFYGLRGATGYDGAFLLYPAIFISAILFDRGSGFFASALSVGFIYLQLRQPDEVLLPAPLLLFLTLFFILALALAALSEAMRKAWEQAVEAERAKDLLLQELGHRTKNSLAIITSVISLQARAITDPGAKAALDNAIARVQVIAGAHEYLNPHAGHERIEMRAYLEELCHRLGETLRDIRPIAVRVEADRVELSSERAVALGLIVNELVTNAFKYAFPDDHSGSVRITLRAGPPLTLVVEDNGVGKSDRDGEGMGTRLVRLLVQQVGGEITRTSADPGSRIGIVFDP